jgi:deoxyhypusine synthase
MNGAPQIARDSVFKASNPLDGAKQVRGYDFNNGVDYDVLLSSFLTTGFQATSFAQAVEEINKMRRWRLSDEPVDENEHEEDKDPEKRAQIKCKIFLGYTSNLVSSGVRESIRFLVQHKMVDCVVSSAGGIEEDFIKCLAPTYLGDFSLPGASLRAQGLNRIGNLLVPNQNYCLFEDWLHPILDKVLEEQNRDGVLWTPSRLIARLGKEINHPDSIYYWAYRNNIPVFCPALTDGSLGDMLYFHSYRNPGLVLDVIQDIRAINNEAIRARRTGIIILGGGLIKHHICNANLFRNGAEYAVYINTANEFDGSDAGARPDEAVSWGKIKPNATPVKIYGDASLVFPLLVAQTFAKDWKEKDVHNQNHPKENDN